MIAVFGIELIRAGINDKSGETFSNKSLDNIAKTIKEVPITIDFKHDCVVGKAISFKTTGIFSRSLYCELRIEMDKISDVLGKCPCIGGKVIKMSSAGDEVNEFLLTEISMSRQNKDPRIGRLEITQTGKRR